MKFLSYLCVAVLAFGAAIFFTNVTGFGTPEYDLSNIGSPSENPQESTEFTTYYDQLNDYQKQLYNALLEPIANAEQELTFTNVNYYDFKNNIFDAIMAIHYDHPEYFWLRGGYSFQASSSRFEETADFKLSPIYYDYVSYFFNASSKSAELTEQVEKVAALAQAHSNDDFERIVFVHDYLIENAYYDHDALDEYFSSSHDPSCEYIFSAYGCLVQGKTVCSGYAKAFQLIMQELGYDCIYVTGDAGEAHGWNCVFLDGEGYFVDVTWDDPDLKQKGFSYEEPYYNYMCIDSDALSKTHKLDTSMFDAPVCNASDYNYFIRSGYYAETYDFSTASTILSAQSGQNAVHIQFGSLDELEKAYNELWLNSKFKDIAGIADFSQYTYNEEHRTLTLLK